MVRRPVHSHILDEISYSILILTQIYTHIDKKQRVFPVLGKKKVTSLMNQLYHIFKYILGSETLKTLC